MADIKWEAPESLTSALTTELNSLANSTSDTTGFCTPSAEIANETGLHTHIALELVVAAQGAARSAGAFVEVWMSLAADGADYGDDSNAAFTGQLLTTFQLDAATTARQLTQANIPIPPLDLKLYARNKTGQAFAASGNTLKYRRYNDQSV